MPPGCAEAAEPRLPVRKPPMKEGAGAFPIRRLLAVGTGGESKSGPEVLPRSPLPADPRAPSFRGFCWQISEKPALGEAAHLDP